MPAIANDGHYELRFSRGKYKAGCRNFTATEAIAHWKSRLKEVEQPCNCSICNRARLFLKAVRRNERERK